MNQKKDLLARLLEPGPRCNGDGTYTPGKGPPLPLYAEAAAEIQRLRTDGGTTMDAVTKYKIAKQAVQAGIALHSLEMAAVMLENIPHVDTRLAKLVSSTAERLRKERNRMLEVQDAAHAKVGTPYPY